MRTIKQQYLIIAALTLVLAVPALAEDMVSQPVDMADVQAAQEPQQPLQGEQCRNDQGSAAGELTVEDLAALEAERFYQETPCQDAAAGSEVSAVAICNCKLGDPCTRPCPSASQTPRCLDINCVSPSSQLDGVCVCVD